MNHTRPPLPDDPNGAEYDALARAYADYWRGHRPDDGHHEEGRTATLRWYLWLRDQGIKPSSGAAVWCGPGFECTEYRDMDPTFVKSYLIDHPQFIIADFSRAVLQNAYECMTRTSKSMRNSVRLAERDFSGGLSARFNAFMSEKIDLINTPTELEALMQDIHTEAISIADIEKHQLSSRRRAAAHESMCSFTEVTGGREPVRFIIANLLLAGMLAITEGSYREKLMELQTRHPDFITDRKFRYYMETWHRFVTEMNNKMSVRFISEALRENPDAHVSLVVDTNAHYQGKTDPLERWNLDAIKRQLAPEGIRMHCNYSWTQDDSAEIPPHTHQILHVSAHKIPHVPPAAEEKLTEGNV